MKLLIAEDEYWVRKRLTTNFDWKELGFDVVFEAENGKQALDICNEHMPDVIITDIRMPLVDGLDMIRQIREKDDRARILIISGYEEFGYAREALRLGVADYLVKPVEEFTLVEAVKNCIAMNERQNIDEEAPPQVVRKIIREALIYMEEHYSEHITMRTVADHVFLSAAYFCRIFREEMGHTFTEHLIQMRLAKVVELLADSRNKISEIAEQAGFNDKQYFYKMFKRYYHTTPTQYREALMD